MHKMYWISLIALAVLIKIPALEEYKFLFVLLLILVMVIGAFIYFRKYLLYSLLIVLAISFISYFIFF